MAEIKISELSIGDWVRYDRGTDAVQIMGIYVRNNQECVVMSDSYYPDGVIGFVWCIKPIPLTPEILEKNGFRKLDRFNEYVIGEWDSNPFIAVRLAEKFVEPTILVKNGGTSTHLFGSRGVNVHQLQHALRLAGVEKEIEV